MTTSLFVSTAVADLLVAGLRFAIFSMRGVLGCSLFDHDCGFLTTGQQEGDYGGLIYSEGIAYFLWSEDQRVGDIWCSLLTNSRVGVLRLW